MRHLRTRAGWGGLVLLAGLGSQACTDDETGLFIQSALALTAPQCVARNDPGSPSLLGGQLDVATRPSYEASLLVGNQFTPRGDKQNLRTETMVTTITGAEVRLFNDVGELTQEFTVPATGVIVPDEGDDPGFGVVDVTLIPATEGVALQRDLQGTAQATRVARVTVFGKTIGGLDVESSEFTFVIRVCEGCLLEQCDPDEDLVACRPGQDALTCAPAP